MQLYYEPTFNIRITFFIKVLMQLSHKKPIKKIYKIRITYIKYKSHFRKHFAERAFNNNSS